MRRVYAISDVIFDYLYQKVESVKGYRFISTFLVFIFILSVFLTFLNNNLNISDSVSKYLPDSYFFAVESVFKLLLAIEIIEMVFVLSHSITNSIAKQFEILSLILLRQGFKEFAQVDLPILPEIIIEHAGNILTDIFGALIIFAGVLIFTRMQKHEKITKTTEDNKNFISAKKGLAVFMIFAFIGIGIYDIVLYFNGAETFKFFSMFYTVLIFTDILIVIIALRYNHLYCVVFRNTGFAVATILIRFALSLPQFYNAAMGIISVIFVIGISIIYNKFMHREIQKSTKN